MIFCDDLLWWSSLMIFFDNLLWWWILQDFTNGEWCRERQSCLNYCISQSSHRLIIITFLCKTFVFLVILFMLLLTKLWNRVQLERICLLFYTPVHNSKNNNKIVKAYIRIHWSSTISYSFIFHDKSRGIKDLEIQSRSL